MFDRFKEFIGIDDNYDEYDEEQAYYDDEYSKDLEDTSSRKNFSDMIDDNDSSYGYEDSNKSLTYESSYNNDSTSNQTSSTYGGYSETSDSLIDSSKAYSSSTYNNESRNQRSSRRGDNVVSMTENNFNNRSSMRISIQEPLDYEQDAPNVINDILDKKVVVLNLEMVDSDMRRRIFDFVSGAVYALDGTVEKVTKGIFVISPKGVEVDNSIAEQISEGNYNQL